MRWRLVLAKGVLCALMSVAGLAHAETLKVVLTPNSVPFSYRDERGELVGFNVDIVRALCAQLARSCQLDTLPFPEILPAVAAGRFDLGVANFLRTPERERLVAFTVPYWRSSSAFVGKRSFAMKAVQELLRDTPVCAIGASVQYRYLIERAGEHSEHVRGLPSNQDVMDALLSGQCPVALLPSMQALPFMQSPRGMELTFLGAPLREAGLGGTVHMAVRPDDAALREAVDRALQHLIATGEHERIARRYFPFSIL